MQMNGLEEVIETVRNINFRAINLYEESANKATNQKTVEFFNILLNQEKTQTSLLEILEKSGLDKFKEKISQKDVSCIQFFDFTPQDIANIAGHNELDYFNACLKGEEEALKIYSSLNKQSGDDDISELLQWLLKGKWYQRKMLSYTMALVSLYMLDMSEKLNIPYISLDNSTVKPELSGLVPDYLIQKFKVFPLSKENGILRLATSNPMDFSAIDTIENATGLSVEPVIVNREEIIDAIDREYGWSLSQEKNLEKLVRDQKSREEQETHKDRLAEEARKQKANTPIVNFVNLLIEQAVDKKASDLHIEPHEQGVDVRIRIDGVLHKLTPPTKQMLPAIISRIKIMAGLDISIRRFPQDGHFMIPEKNIDIRVSTLPTVEGEKAVLRLLDKSKLVRGLSDLGLEPDQLRFFQQALQKPQGVILVTGPTGSGKTTTLYSGLNYLVKVDNNIVTVEDPVEYRIPYKSATINQVQVQHSIEMSFATALRSILRQDPDIIMVGEIRDLETAQLVVRAALTGHLVLSTIHTNSAIATINRLQDMGIQTYMLGSSLNLIIAQRLVRRICEHCKEPLDDNSQLRMKLQISPETTLYQGKGCKACLYTGYLGRIAIYEMLPVNHKIADAITRNAGEEELFRLAESQGMSTLRRSGIRKIEQGITTIEEIMARTMGDD